MKKETKKEKREKRHRRIRAKIQGTADRPRLCVFRSNKHIYAQLIDDQKGETLASANDLELDVKKNKTSKSENRKVKLAFEVGKLIAQKAKKKKIKKVVFDRGGYRYHGRLKALAKGARKGGLKF